MVQQNSSEDIYTEPRSVDVDTLRNLGPLRALAGVWQGVRGLDVKPKADGPRKQAFVERIELQPIEGRPGARAFAAFKQAFADGILIRTTGDIIALSPPLVLEKKHIDELFGKLATVLKNLE